MTSSCIPAAGAFQDAAFRRLPLAVMLASAAACLAWGPGWSVRAAPWPWLASLALVGLPHGAADLAVTRRLLGRTGVLRLFVGYTAIMLIVGAAFATWPATVLASFLALSGWHFGAAHADGQSPPLRRRPGGLFLAAVARGASVIGMPLAAWPEAAAEVARSLAALAGTDWVADPAAIRSAGTACVAVGAASLAAEAWSTRQDPGGPGRSLATLGELTVFGGLAVVADPLFSVGTYFLCWHAWRQMRLLAPVIGATPIHDARSLARALGEIHLAALPLLVPTWAALAALWWLVPAAHSTRGLAILSLAVYIVVTPSHDLLRDWWRSRTTSDEAAGRRPRRQSAGSHGGGTLRPRAGATQKSNAL